MKNKATPNLYKQTKTTNNLPTLIIDKMKTKLESHTIQKRTVSFKKTIESQFWKKTKKLTKLSFKVHNVKSEGLHALLHTFPFFV
jgi:hypothetical protein